MIAMHKKFNDDTFGRFLVFLFVIISQLWDGTGS